MCSVYRAIWFSPIQTISIQMEPNRNMMRMGNGRSEKNVEWLLNYLCQNEHDKTKPENVQIQRKNAHWSAQKAAKDNKRIYW